MKGKKGKAQNAWLKGTKGKDAKGKGHSMIDTQSEEQDNRQRSPRRTKA